MSYEKRRHRLLRCFFVLPPVCVAPFSVLDLATISSAVVGSKSALRQSSNSPSRSARPPPVLGELMGSALAVRETLEREPVDVEADLSLPALFRETEWVFVFLEAVLFFAAADFLAGRGLLGEEASAAARSSRIPAASERPLSATVAAASTTLDTRLPELSSDLERQSELGQSSRSFSQIERLPLAVSESELFLDVVARWF